MNEQKEKKKMHITNMEMSAYNLEKKPMRLRRIPIAPSIIFKILTCLSEGNVRMIANVPEDVSYLRHYMGWNQLLYIVMQSDEFERVEPKMLIPEWQLVFEAIKPKPGWKESESGLVIPA